MIEKLKNFPQIYYVSYYSSLERRVELELQFQKYKIRDFNAFITTDEIDNASIIKGPFLHQMHKATINCVTSHLRALKYWYQNSKEQYLIMFEDDVFFNTIDYWNFSWDQFMSKLPNQWDCIQLLVIRQKLSQINFRQRQWNDWAATAYLIKREYVNRLLEQYYPQEEFLLTIPYGNIIPLVENIIFGLGNVYVVPLFVENVHFNSTFYGRHTQTKQNADHIESAQYVLNWWKINPDNQLNSLFNKEP
jgi:GR25 family glycosyltransferase involved in LPS biosynthesis